MNATADHSTFDIAPWGPSVRAYAAWIDRRDKGTARLWARRLASMDQAQVEGAVAEATTWDFLSNRIEEVEAGDASKGGPDFRCRAAGTEFFVEVTNIARSVVTKHTKLPELPSGPRRYRDLTAVIKREVCAKAGQGGKLEAPYLVMVTTLHAGAAVCFSRTHVEHVLHSTTALSGNFDDEKGEIVGPFRRETSMKMSAFTKQYSTDSMRRNISAVLVSNLGTYPKVEVLGVLHPDPVRPLDPTVLPDIPFCQFQVWPPDPSIIVEWSLAGE